MKAVDMQDKRQGVTILGSTGSIGINSLDVIGRHPDRFRVVALTAHSQVDRLFEQCLKYSPEIAVLRDESAARHLETRLRDTNLPTRVQAGERALDNIAASPSSSIVMAAIVGAAGLMPVLAAVRAGKRVLIANKEPLVMSGHLLVQEALRSGAMLLPIDSEHNAIFQCLPAGSRAGVEPAGVRRILLTCSGGPFHNAIDIDLDKVTPEQAVAHPRWSMGRKISVDSATLMNKGLELIEACRLFSVGPDQVQIVIHPQSIIHSLVEYTDGSMLAQLGNPDMRTPIAHALAWPDRMESGVTSLDLFEIARLDFKVPDTDRFPCLQLAERAIRTGGTTPAILNAANEIAVAAFLDKKIAFTGIPEIIAGVLDELPATADDTLDSILDADVRAREAASRLVTRTPSKLRSLASR